MADFYKSKFTGQQIDEYLQKASNIKDIVANPTDESNVELIKLKIGNETFYIPKATDDIIANPNEEASVDLVKLKIGGTTYLIPSGGGNVEANPTEAATRDLSKIKIGNVVYNIPVFEPTVKTLIKHDITFIVTTEYDDFNYKFSCLDDVASRYSSPFELYTRGLANAFFSVGSSSPTRPENYDIQPTIAFPHPDDERYLFVYIMPELNSQDPGRTILGRVDEFQDMITPYGYVLEVE